MKPIPLYSCFSTIEEQYLIKSFNKLFKDNIS